MNDEIRGKVDELLKEKGLTRSDLARAAGKTPQAITRALNGGKDGGGQLPGIWAAIFDALDVKLTIERKDG
ncbi:helix-turn-helix domain-containing protein [Deinococcus yavapaiensis]|uniref:Helix-turn-helix protein n=1 Tax=Deinococcus yavapaiensis KR-236 TaxID=694435 RepID=A0A318RYS6_9DEIO|nr:helix-turn-helix transcriptional regulator [Deinococcus yavapaiensis]PYE48379.1 helix-turn-helix protein [Deinococcus yavapaiensis KR-236]